MGLALVLCLYDCCPLTPSYTRAHTTTPKQQASGRSVFVILLDESFTPNCTGSCVIKRIEAIGCKKRSAVYLEVDWRDLGQGQTLCDHHHSSSTTFSKCPPSISVSFPIAWVVHYHTHTSSLPAPYCTTLPELPGRYLSIRIYCVALQSQRGGERVCVCVCHLWLCLFCNGGYFSLLWRIRLLRNEEAGYLPDSDGPEVITVLYWKDDVQEWRLGERQLGSFALCFSWKH